MQSHVKVALVSDSDCAEMFVAPQTSFPLILMFGAESFSCAIILPVGGVARLGLGELLALSFLAPDKALQFAVPDASFKFVFPPSCMGTGVVLEVLGA
jgi:hypothetical protein